ncbi:MAG: hypothetical protein A2711_04115 [Burkholderiales bacterium RIFCSPHIGHO2_01_FULL_63_240]|nr:MAG: hypothetical protein A2711_04115 [Burkholderiales bacterium RIFCSPHIGHO2_01_FULL_63_240]
MMCGRQRRINIAGIDLQTSFAKLVFLLSSFPSSLLKHPRHQLSPTVSLIRIDHFPEMLLDRHPGQ